MPFFYEVRDTTDLERIYPCGPWPDAEAAIMHFHTKYGQTTGKRFTTLPTGTSCADYVLVEQAKSASGQIGLHDVRSIALYRQ
jgi:hypothetical protein